jgi:nucleotide-binding universal stress UspA family protein
MPGITVGIDGSPNARRALDRAVREAATCGSQVTVLTVHPVIASYVTGAPVTVPADAGLQEKERQAAEEVVQQALRDAGTAQPASVHVRSVSGFPVEELLEAARHSDQLVIGARGGGGFRRLSLGSVSTQVLHHAACPVTVVPGPER